MDPLVFLHCRSQYAQLLPANPRFQLFVQGIFVALGRRCADSVGLRLSTHQSPPAASLPSALLDEASPQPHSRAAPTAAPAAPPHSRKAIASEPACPLAAEQRTARGSKPAAPPREPQPWPAPARHGAAPRLSGHRRAQPARPVPGCLHPPAPSPDWPDPSPPSRLHPQQPSHPGRKTIDGKKALISSNLSRVDGCASVGSLRVQTSRRKGTERNPLPRCRIG